MKIFFEVLALFVLTVDGNRTYVRDCPYCRDLLVWQKRYYFPGFVQSMNAEPLSTHTCLHPNETFLTRGCDYSCLEVEIVLGQSSHTYFYRDCSEELVKRLPCAECWPETTADYSYMTVNKTIPIYDEVGDKWTFKFCASDNCSAVFRLKELDPVVKQSSENAHHHLTLYLIGIVTIASTVLVAVVRVVCLRGDRKSSIASQSGNFSNTKNGSTQSVNTAIGQSAYDAMKKKVSFSLPAHEKDVLITYSCDELDDSERTPDFSASNEASLSSLASSCSSLPDNHSQSKPTDDNGNVEMVDIEPPEAPNLSHNHKAA